MKQKEEKTQINKREKKIMKGRLKLTGSCVESMEAIKTLSELSFNKRFCASGFWLAYNTARAASICKQW